MGHYTFWKNPKYSFLRFTASAQSSKSIIVRPNKVISCQGSLSCSFARMQSSQQRVTPAPWCLPTQHPMTLELLIQPMFAHKESWNFYQYLISHVLFFHLSASFLPLGRTALVENHLGTIWPQDTGMISVAPLPHLQGCWHHDKFHLWAAMPREVSCAGHGGLRLGNPAVRNSMKYPLIFQ